MGKKNFTAIFSIILSLFFSAVQSWAFPALLAEAPTSTLALTTQAILSAKKSLQINIYEMTSPAIKDAIINRIRSGVSVSILQEGQPVGGFPTDSQTITTEISTAMKQNRAAHHRYVLMTGTQSSRRFHFDHGKYIVVDGQNLLIGSENYSPTAQLMQNNEIEALRSSLGNRGWEAFLSDATLAQNFKRLFEEDSASKHSDLMEADTFLAQLKKKKRPSDTIEIEPAYVSQDSPSVVTHGSPRTLPFTPPTTVDVESAEMITSPNTSLNGLLTLIKSAKKSLDLEMMTFSLTWGGPGMTSPLYTEVVKAARRGVRVRVLLNDERAFSANAKQKNLLTTNALQKIATQEHLDVTAVVANLPAMGVRIIHNKGVIVDGEKTLISSINWNQNSVEYNRETAVVLSSKAVAAHYQAIFDEDFSASLQ